MPSHSSRRPSVRLSRMATVVSIAVVVVLAGCAGLGLGGGNGDGDAMPFMNHSTERGPPTPAGDNSTTTVAGPSNTTLQESELVTVANQTSDGRTVTIRSFTLSEGGYVAIHDARRMNASLAGNLIGVSEYLEPGNHATVTVRLFDVPGHDFGDNPHLMGSPPVFATLHHDTTGNATFEYVTSGTTEDGVYRTDTGAVAVDFAVLTVQHETHTG